MHPAFYIELEKIGRSTGEGSRGGKVVGRTKSGDPIYEGSKGKGKKGWLRKNWKTLAGVAGGAAAIGAIAGRMASKRSIPIRTAGDWNRRQTAWDKAKRAYDQAGGSGGAEKGRKASKETWRRYSKAGDDYFGSNSTWRDYKRAEQENYRGWKQYHKSGGRTGGGPRPRAGTSGPKPGTSIPGLGRLKTKAEAKAAYKDAAMKHHPDRGGSTEKMQQVNAEWAAFQKSPAWEKLAMARYWSALADALIR